MRPVLCARRNLLLHSLLPADDLLGIDRNLLHLPQAKQLSEERTEEHCTLWLVYLIGHNDRELLSMKFYCAGFDLT